MSNNTGPLGLDTFIVGRVVQALGEAATEREKVSREQVIAYLTSESFDEADLWHQIEPIVDQIEDAVADYFGTENDEDGPGLVLSEPVFRIGEDR